MGAMKKWGAEKQMQVIQSQDGQKRKGKGFLLTEGLELTLRKKPNPKQNKKKKKSVMLNSELLLL